MVPQLPVLSSSQRWYLEQGGHVTKIDNSWGWILEITISIKWGISRGDLHMTDVETCVGRQAHAPLTGSKTGLALCHNLRPASSSQYPVCVWLSPCTSDRCKQHWRCQWNSSQAVGSGNHFWSDFGCSQIRPIRGGSPDLADYYCLRTAPVCFKLAARLLVAMQLRTALCCPAVRVVSL